MQEVPEELFRQDVHSFPSSDDPATLAKMQKQQAAFDKEQKAMQAQQKKLDAAEEKRVKKDMALPTTKDKEVAAIASYDHDLTLHKIRLYFNHFGDKLSVKQPKTLPKDEAGARELLATIELELRSTGGIEQAATGYLAALQGAEQISMVFNPLGLDLSGPALSLSQAAAMNKPKWNDMITEFAISHAEWFMIGPGMRILMFTLQLVLAVDQSNKAARNKHVPPSEDLKGKGEDL